MRINNLIKGLLLFTAVFALAEARPGPPEQRKPATIIEPSSRLMWIADAAFAFSAGAPDVFMSRTQAERLVAAMNEGRLENFGFTDWRLPSVKEVEQFLASVEGGQLPASPLNLDFFRARVARNRLEQSAKPWSSPGVPHRVTGDFRESDKSVYFWPVRGVIVEAGFADAVLFATNSINVQNKAQVNFGDLVVNEASPGPTLNSDVELSVGAIEVAATNWQGDLSTISGISSLKADSVKVHKQAQINGDVYFNDLDNNGTINGNLFTPLTLPVFSLLPPFISQEPAPGSPDVSVPAGGSETLPAGDYGHVTVLDGGTLTFSGGIYNVLSVTGGIGTQLLFDNPSEVRVQERFLTLQDSIVGPSSAGPPEMRARDIIFFVAGINGTTGALGDAPVPVDIGRLNDVDANFYAPNGTVHIRRDGFATGAFLGKDVEVDQNTVVELDSFYINRPPNAEDDSLTVDEGASSSTLDSGETSLLANDSDRENDTLTVSPSPVSGPDHGTLILNPDGTFLYTHDGSETTSDSFIYQVCDDGYPPECATATVSITVNPVNDPPTAVDDHLTVAEGGLASVGVVQEDGTTHTLDGGATSVLANDSDIENNNLLVSTELVAEPFHANVLMNPDGTFVYIHNGSEGSTDSFQYQVCDDGVPSACSTAVVFVTVTPVNDPPVAANDFISVLEGGTATTLIGGANSVLANDFDPEGDALVVSTIPVVRPANGSLVLNSNGTFSYTHSGDEVYSDSFVYRVCEVLTPTFCATALVAIDVTPVNDPPTANSQVVFTDGATPLPVPLTGSDPENNDLTFSIVSGPSHGTLGAVQQGPAPSPGDPPRTSATVVYTPNTADNLADSFTFQVSDGLGGTDTAVIQINPIDVADSPSPDDPIDTVRANELLGEVSSGGSILFNLTGDAPEDVALSFSIVSPPANGSLSTLTPGSEVPQRSAAVEYSSTFGFQGVDSFVFEACGTVNSQLVCDTATVSITVFPLASDQTVQTPPGTEIQIDLTGGFGGESSGQAIKPQLYKLTALPTIPRGPKAAAFLDSSEIAGNVADSNGDGLGDNHNALPGGSPVLISAGVGLSGGAGSNGTVRIHIEYDLSSLPVSPDVLESAQVLLTTRRGTVDSLDTFFFAGLNGQDGALTDSDFQFPVEPVAGAVMPVPPGQAVGEDGSFEFDVTSHLRSALQNNSDFFVVQGRVDESFATGRGLQIYSTADGNLSNFLQPLLAITTPGVVAPQLSFQILSLPSNGVLRDANGTLITQVPTQIFDPNVLYQPNIGFLGTDTFQFQISDGVNTANALVSINVALGSCSENPAFCDDGR